MRADFCLGDWIVSPRRGFIEREEKRVRIDPKPMAVLECLADAGGEVVTRGELHEAVWPGVIVTDDALTRCIAELRRAFGDSARNSKYIKTIPKVGFCLLPPVAALAEKKRTPGNRLSKHWLGVGAMVLLLAAFAAWHGMDMNQNGTPASVPQRSSLAVLPLVNLSANPKDGFFVDGIHDDLLTHISKIGGIKTISRTSVMRYRDSTQSIPEIAQELGVSTILEGGVQRAGDQIRINVQLIDATTDEHLWAEFYDRQLTASNVFAIQREVAEAVAKALRAELTPQARERIESVPTENLAALEAYFLGRQSMATRTIADLAEAVEHFQTAITLDPGFALAHVGLANAIWLHEYFSGISSEETRDRVQAAVKQALDLDPLLGEAHTARANNLRWIDEEGTEAAYRRALELSPNDAESYQWYGWWLLNKPGRQAEGLELIQKAVSLDPRSAIIVADLGDALERNGRLDEALEQYEKAIEIQPKLSFGYWKFAELMIRLGRLDQAALAYHEAFKNDPDQWRNPMLLGSLYRSMGDDRQAEHWFRLALEKAPQGTAQTGHEFGRVHPHRGEREQARQHFDSMLSSNPSDQIALYHLVNLYLAEGNTTGALKQYQRTFPGLLGDEPIVDADNHQAAILLAAIYSQTGELERLEQLLDRAWENTEAQEFPHFDDRAAIQALRGDNQAALEALGSIDPMFKVMFWRELIVGHPAFLGLLDSPEFRALNDEFEAEMAEQLVRVRELEASGELAPLPGD